MQDLVIKALIAIGFRLLTEKFIARTLLRAARGLADSTDTALDDGWVDDWAEALGQPDLKKTQP